MSDPLHLVLVPRDDHRAFELAPHVVARLGGAVRAICRQIEVPRASHGVAIFSGTALGRSTHFMCGVDEHSGHLAVRVHAPTTAGARAAALTFPAVLFAILLLARSLGGTGALPGAFVAGGLLAFFASWGAFTFVRRTGGRAEDTVHAAAIIGRLEPALAATLDPLGLDVRRGTVRLCGLDTGFGAQDADAPADERAWTALMKQALEAVAI